jgi:hypothetical protein
MTDLHFDRRLKGSPRFSDFPQRRVGTGMPICGWFGGAGPRKSGRFPCRPSMSARPPTPWPPGMARREARMAGRSRKTLAVMRHRGVITLSDRDLHERCANEP